MPTHIPIQHPELELLSPAGDYERLVMAVQYGADAVYLGLNQYNARIHAANFTLETLREALEYAHLRNARIYVTLNTLLDEDLRQIYLHRLRIYEYLLYRLLSLRQTKILNIYIVSNYDIEILLYRLRILI